MTSSVDPVYRAAIERFDSLYRQAAESEPGETSAMTLATADGEGRPSARTVLLKQYDERGFVFYTNHHSRKGRDLEANPRAALLFLWQSLARQVRVEGVIEVVDDSDADAYWASRPRASQLGAWASHQSETLASREEYEQRLADHEREFADRDVPRLPHWSGFRVMPDRIEFWHEREYRQHERECCWFNGERWQWSLLNP